MSAQDMPADLIKAAGSADRAVAVLRVLAAGVAAWDRHVYLAGPDPVRDGAIRCDQLAKFADRIEAAPPQAVVDPSRIPVPLRWGRAMFAVTDAKAALFRAGHALDQLYLAGHDFGPWMQAILEARGALAVVESEIGDELRKDSDARSNTTR